ncbi:MAG: PaaI family thioesterase [Ruminiclostridium sp.]|nr:PaaI family thioesterase [Ruminiclostridium sp.]MBQ9933052.1 PaaI family thioesterase [Ruminiclostridium sp.]
MDYTDKINATNAKNSFMLHNGIRLTAMEKDYAKVEAHLTRENRNLYNAVHGGMFLTMGDCAAGGAARSNGMRYVTVSSSFEFYRNTKDDHLIAEGRIKNRGNTICVAEVEIHDGQGKLLCGGTFTLYCVGSQDDLSEE